jgi:hypothetical protein
MDFGFGLSLRIRKGIFYNKMLENRFPNVMKIRYKDSYGNRADTLRDKMLYNYGKMRLKMSYASRGILIYSPFQAEYFYLQKNGIDDYKELVLDRNCIAELINNSQMEKLFTLVKQQQYLFNLFQRVLFIQLFFNKYQF